MQHLNQTPRKLYQKTIDIYKTGEKYGIEFELEASNYLPSQKTINELKLPISRKQDNSLRGNSAEFITSIPLSFEDVKKVCDDFYTLLKEHKTKILENSPRTSTHVHINFEDRPIKKIIDFICLFYSVENLILSLAGPKRIHNQFCYSLQDAEQQLQQLENLLSWEKNVNNPGTFKYANLNICNLSTIGTLEVRSLEGYPTKQKLFTWLQILHEIYEVSQNNDFSVQSHIIENISALSPARWLTRTIPTLAKALEAIPEYQIEQAIYEDFRLIQPFIYKYNTVLNKLQKEGREPEKKLELKKPDLSNIEIKLEEENNLVEELMRWQERQYAAYIRLKNLPQHRIIKKVEDNF